MLVDGTRIARSWAALGKHSIEAPINVTERGEPAPIAEACGGDQPAAWSGAKRDGTLLTPACGDFTMGAGLGHGGIAAPDYLYNWCASCSGFDCSKKASLYCFEQ